MSNLKRRDLISWLTGTSLFSVFIPTSNVGASILNPISWFSSKSGLSLLPYHPTKIVVKTVLEKGSLHQSMPVWRNKSVLDAELGRLTQLGHMISCNSVKTDNSITCTYEFSNETHRKAFAEWLVHGQAISVEKMRSLGIKTYHNLS